MKILLTTHLECGHWVPMVIEEQDINAALNTKSMHCQKCHEERVTTVRDVSVA